ncbi:hypothetical protein [Brevundimonas phoenicis]|uniref:hypothetical protein n=1 Tax=unclassified Brevundimonas TaxID=2622653 RepID=UPI0039A2FA81
MFGRKRIRDLTGEVLVRLLNDNATFPQIRQDIGDYDDIDTAADLSMVYFWQNRTSGDFVASINESKLAAYVARTVHYDDKHFPTVLREIRDFVRKMSGETMQQLINSPIEETDNP